MGEKFSVKMFADLETDVLSVIQKGQDAVQQRTVPLFGLIDETKARSHPIIVSKAFHTARVEKSDDDELRSLQRSASDLYAGMILYKMTNLDRHITDAEAFKWMLANHVGQEYLAKTGKFLKSVGKPDAFIRKALDTAESGGGADFIPTNFSGELIEDYRTETFTSKVNHRHVRMTSATFEMPVVGEGVKTRLDGENTGDDTHTETNFFTAVDPNTLSPQLIARKLAMRTVFSNEVNEESVVPWIPFLQTEVKEAAIRGFEQAVISGDTTGTHQDYDVNIAAGNATDSRRAFLGYRGASFDQTPAHARVNGGNTRPTDRKLSDVLVAMGKYGHRTDDVFWLGPPKARQWLARLPEDRFMSSGGQDTYDGFPVHYSDEMPTNLDDSGINTNGGDNDTSSLLAVTASRWIIGDMRELSIKVVDREESDQKVMIVSERVGFRQVDTPATTMTVGNLFNLK